MRVHLLGILAGIVASLALNAVAPASRHSSDAGTEDDAHWWGCRTTCGLYAPLAKDCVAFQQEEDRIRRAYALAVKGWTLEKSCQAFDGWTVVVQAKSSDEGAWPLHHKGEPDYWVYGLTVQASRVIIVGRDNWRESALAHELGHVLDMELAHSLGGHPGWTRRGLCTAINIASNLKDDCTDAEYTQD